MSKTKITKLQIKGMHCPACEVLITDKFKEADNVKNVQANFRKLEATITHTGELNIHKLNSKIKEFGYQIVSGPLLATPKPPLVSRLMDVLIITVVLITIYFFAQKLNLIPNIGGSNGLTVVTALLLGLVASVSTCMATSGALFLSTIGGKEQVTDNKIIPAISFSLGRVVSYTIVGFLAGYVGKALTSNLQVGILLTLVVSVFLILVGLDMSQIVETEKIIGSTATKGIFEKLTSLFKTEPKKTALILGALTVLLPCGFTQTVLVYAVGLASPVQSALLMGAFALGTVPMFLVLGFINSFTKASWYTMLQKVMGVVVLLIGLSYAINFLSLLGVQMPFANQRSTINGQQNQKIILKNGVQEIHMKVNARGYYPNTLTIKKGIPVKWVVEGEDVYGCQGSLLSPKIGVQKVLVPGDNIFEFTPTESGVIPFSCGMGMFRGQFQVE